MCKTGILAGGGKLPLAIGNKLIEIGYEVEFFCIEPFALLSDYYQYKTQRIKLESLSNILTTLKKRNIKQIVMAGNVKRPSLKDIKFDLNTIKLIREFSLQDKGDNKLLSAISSLFIKNNFKILDWKNLCRDLFIQDDYITIKKPSKISLQNLTKGLIAYKLIGELDLSQSLIIQNEIILGIEAAEGTDELIKRCYQYKKRGDKGVLIKLSKYNQNSKIDLPVIGLNTVQLLKKYDYEGIFLEKNNCILLEKSKVVDYCNKSSLFIFGVNKI